MRAYADACSAFSLDELERRTLVGSLANGLNACVECCDRWADDPDRVALDWFGVAGERERVTYHTLRADAARFANLLAERGIEPGDVIAGLLPRTPELLTVVLGTWRAGAVYQPLFTAFGPKAIEDRIGGPQGSQAKLIVVDPANRRKLDDVTGCPPTLLLDRRDTSPFGFAAQLAAQPDAFEPVSLTGSDLFVLLFTSGTTGRAKGVGVSLKVLLQIAAFVGDGFGLRSSDTYWCLADPAWALGMYGTLIGPLLFGNGTVLYEGPFSVESTVRVIAEAGVTNLVGAPTVFRLLRAAGDDAVTPIARQLQRISSGGEPLNAEIARWGAMTLGQPIAEFYGQTEMGINVCNHQGLVHPWLQGSAGQVSPGYVLAVLGDDLEPVAPGEQGVLAVDRERSPLFCFTGYFRTETPAFRGRWYLSGDRMRQDADGYFHFIGRNDDVITSAGYRIGPADVENAIIEHPAVAEVAVIGKPDPERTEIVKAFIVLRGGYRANTDLGAAIQTHVRERLSLHAYPREIEFLDELPKTPSGKVQRFVLRERERHAPRLRGG